MNTAERAVLINSTLVAYSEMCADKQTKVNPDDNNTAATVGTSDDHQSNSASPPSSQESGAAADGTSCREMMQEHRRRQQGSRNDSRSRSASRPRTGNAVSTRKAQKLLVKLAGVESNIRKCASIELELLNKAKDANDVEQESKLLHLANRYRKRRGSMSDRYDLYAKLMAISFPSLDFVPATLPPAWR